VIEKALERGAVKIQRLLSRRKSYLVKISQLDDELARARKDLRDLIRDVATPETPGTQRTLDDEL